MKCYDCFNLGIDGLVQLNADCENPGSNEVTTCAQSEVCGLIQGKITLGKDEDRGVCVAQSEWFSLCGPVNGGPFSVAQFVWSSQCGPVSVAY